MSEAVQSAPKHIRWSEVPVENVNPLFQRQLVVGTKVMMAHILLKKDCEVPLHQHTNEQVSYVESGSMKFFIDGKEIIVKAGEFICIPPDMPHSAVALEDFVGLDIFTPPREDWLNKTDSYLRR
ncbi:MAG: cupin domain-containing protein [Acidobacteriaceae bacterium]|nr:cupin domain-containing protein [Acidobacteriaceae bacterium]